MNKPGRSQYGITEEEIERFHSIIGKIEAVGGPSILLGILFIGLGAYLAFVLDRWWGVLLIVFGVAITRIEDILKWAAFRKAWIRKVGQFNLDSAEYERRIGIRGARLPVDYDATSSNAGSTAHPWVVEAGLFLLYLVPITLLITSFLFEPAYDRVIEEVLGFPRWIGGTFALVLLGLAGFTYVRLFNLRLRMWRMLLGVPLLVAALGTFVLTPIAGYAYPHGDYYFTGDYFEPHYGATPRPEYREDLSTVDIPEWVRIMRSESLLDVVFGIVYAFLGAALVLSKGPSSANDD
jgi:hypothetical protein